MINETGHLSFSVLLHFCGGSQPAKTSTEATVDQKIRAFIVRKRYSICMKTQCLHPASKLEAGKPEVGWVSFAGQRTSCFTSPEDGILFRMIQNNMFKGCHLLNSLSNFELTDFNSKMSPFLIFNDSQ